MIINIEEVQKLIKRLDELELIPLEQVEWYKDGEKLEIPKSIIDDWKFTGLGNKSFVDFQVYLDKIPTPERNGSDATDNGTDHIGSINAGQDK